MTTTTKRLTIILTGRAPVTIDAAQWPLIAAASGDSCVETDLARREQALANGECDLYSLRVRAHADGRAIVAGSNAPANVWICRSWAPPRKEGELVGPGDDVAAAVARVGAECELPAHVVRACIADLPAVMM